MNATFTFFSFFLCFCFIFSSPSFPVDNNSPFSVLNRTNKKKTNECQHRNQASGIKTKKNRKETNYISVWLDYFVNLSNIWMGFIQPLLSFSFFFLSLSSLEYLKHGKTCVYVVLVFTIRQQITTSNGNWIHTTHTYTFKQKSIWKIHRKVVSEYTCCRRENTMRPHWHFIYEYHIVIWLISNEKKNYFNYFRRWIHIYENIRYGHSIVNV